MVESKNTAKPTHLIYEPSDTMTVPIGWRLLWNNGETMDVFTIPPIDKSKIKAVAI